MNDESKMIHGGDRYRNQVQYDFSVNINPLGIPQGIRKAMQLAAEDADKYPDIRYEKLRAAIGKKHGISPDAVICGNGASELLSAVLLSLRPKRVFLPVPSFYGYERAAFSCGAQITYFHMKEEYGFSIRRENLKELERELKDTDLMILANPNNPTGAMVSADVLEELLSFCREREIMVLLDECFIQFTEKKETASFIQKLEVYPNLAVIRAYTKIYAIPGVRLGYLVTANKELQRKLRLLLPEWNVSIFAEYAGLAAEKEQEYLAETAAFVKKEREFLEQALKDFGIQVYPSEAVYLLVRTELLLYERLLAEKILIRDCRNFRGLGEGFYRIAVKKHTENEILLSAVRKLVTE